MHSTSPANERRAALQPKKFGAQTPRKGRHGQRVAGRWANSPKTSGKGDGGYGSHGPPEQSTTVDREGPSSFSDLSMVEVRADAMPNTMKQVLLRDLPKSVWFECPVIDVLFSDDGDSSASGTSWMSQSGGEWTVATPRLKAASNAAIELLAQLPTGGAAFSVSAADVRLPPHSSAHELFVPRVGVSAEYHIFEPLPGWVPCRVIRLEEDIAMTEIELDNGEIKAVAENLLRKAFNDAHLRKLDHLGGIIRETLEVPLDNCDLDEYLEDQIEEIKRKAKPFKVIVSRSEAGASTSITLIGLPSSVARCKVLLNNFFKSSKPGHQTQERRERRLKLLAERREAYDGSCVLEFHVEESLIGLIIGRQGEKLSRVAKDFQVELRVLPDEDGARRVRVYGPTMELINRAREELELVYQLLTLEPASYQMLTSERFSQLRDISQKAGLHSSWLDPTKHALVIWGSRRCLESFRVMLDAVFRPHSMNDPRSGHRHFSMFQVPEYSGYPRSNSFRPSYADWDNPSGHRTGKQQFGPVRESSIQPLWNPLDVYGEDCQLNTMLYPVPFNRR